MDNKLTVCLLFGGKSGEHEVSLQSAKSIYEALDKKRYNVILVGIDKNGHWLLENSSNYLLNANNPKLIALNKTSDTPEVTAISSQSNTQLINVTSGKPVSKIDVFIPMMHGTFGEDGSMQGFLELMDAAYVGAGVLGSAVGMDKDVMKRLLNFAGIPIAKFVTLHKNDNLDLDKIIETLHFPLFVKPANSGSSVGISKAKNIEEMKRATDEAFLYDTKIMFEEYIEGREIECSVLGNDNPETSVLGEVTPTHEFYSYAAKYIDENGAILKIPAELSVDTIKNIQDMAIKAFKIIECSGMARVDFFLTKDNKIYVNELNTIPGFTKISMYPKLWEASGLPYSKLLDKLIDLAIEKRSEKNKLKRSFDM